MFLKKKGWGKGLTIALVFTFLFQCFFMMAPEPASAATTELTITKYADDRTTIIDQVTVDYHWLEDPDNIPVLGDGITRYYLQGPVFIDQPADKPEELERLRWNEEEDQNWYEKDMGAVKGNNLMDLCELAGGMEEGDEVQVKGVDGFSYTFGYENVYNYDPNREGPMVLCWYKDGQYPDSGYADGMRLVWFAASTYKDKDKVVDPDEIVPGEYHVFGNWDWHQAAEQKYWYYYQGKYPTTTGLSVQKVAYINIYSNETVLTSPDLNADTESNQIGQAVDITFTDDEDWRTAISRITVNGIQLTDEYSTSEGTIIINEDVFDTPGEYRIAVSADGYSMATVTQSMVAAPSAPVAAFSADETSGPVPLTVQFTDESTANPASWEWDFDNDGEIDSTEQNPSYEYTAVGTYTVKLTVTNDLGSDDETKEDYITVTPAGPQTWYVDDSGGADFTNIQEAITAARASDTIIVKDGTYTENITVDKSLTIKSENGADKTIIQAANTSADVIKVTAENVIIDGFTASGATGNGKSGIYLTYVSGQPSGSCTVKNNDCSGNNRGITVNCNNNTVSYNTCNSCGSDGFYFSNGTGNTITNNTSANNKSGKGFNLFDSTDNSIFRDNTLDSNNMGIRVKAADANTFYNNIISNNTIGLELATKPVNNKFYLNNFIDNTTQLSEGYNGNTENSWNSPTELAYTYKGSNYSSQMGNYWSNYTGADNNDDGIGDTSFDTIASYKDNYPLMGAWQDGVITASTAAVTGVSITEGDQELEVDETVQLHAVVEPENATNKSVIWSISDDTIATVSETGLVTAVEVGTADITVTTEDGGKTDSITVTVTAGAANVPLTIAVKENGTETQTFEYNLNDWELERQYYSIKDSSGKYRFGAAEGVYLEDILNDAEIDIETINSFKFISSETPPFTASITSELLNEQRYYYPNIFSENKEDGAQVVKPMLAVKSYVGDRDVSTLPSWDSMDDENTIRLFFGQKNVDDVNYSSFAKLVCRIEVEVTETSGPVAVTGVSITEGDQELEVDETVQLNAVVEPENATNKSVTWSSSDETFATVSETGLVTAVAVGTAEITVTTEDGNKTDSITVTVAEGSGGPTIDVLFEGTVSLTPDETFTVTVGTNQYTIDENTPLGALQAAAEANSFTYVLSDKRWSYDQVLLLDDVGEYVRKSPGYWYAYVNDVYKDGYQNNPDGLNVIELVDGDQVEFYYAADISDATDLNAVKAAATAAVKTIASIEVPSTMDVLYEGTVSLTPDETFTVTVGTNQYTIDENTPLGALHAASVANDFTYVASDKKWGESGILLLDDIGPYPYQKNGNRWFAYVNGVFKDGYDATADALNIIELADGDTVEYYYVHKDTDKNDLNAVKAAATAAVKTVASISTIDVLYDGTVALDPDETFTVTIGSNQYTIDQNTPLGALHAAALAQGFTYLASDKKWSENELLLLDDIGDYPYQKNGNRWFAYVNDVFKDGYDDPADGLNIIELVDQDTVEFYYVHKDTDKNNLQAVKDAAIAAVKTVAATGVAPTEWTLQLSGAKDENVTKAYFEQGLACPSSGHQVTWTDDKGTPDDTSDDDVWGGVPLWLLVALVDDDPDVGDEHYNFNDELAAEDYEVKVIAGDGWSTTLSSAAIARSDAYIVANTLNGEPLPLKIGDKNKDCWPLYLKGSAISGGQQVGNIVRIELSGLPEPPAGWTLEMLGEVGDTITQEEFEEGLACTGSGHYQEWTDIEGKVWSGVPLWVLLGTVDDIENSTHWTFDDSLAASYNVTVINGDGTYSKTFAGADVANSNDYIVANKYDGEPLTDNSAPLRLVGDGVTKTDGTLGGLAVGNIAKIEIPELQTPAAEPGSWNLTLKGKISDVISEVEFEAGLACPHSGHLVEWTDADGNEWSGIPLWFLAGWVDDRQPHNYDFNQAVAGYKVVVKASDGYSTDFDSADINKNSNYIIANKCNGVPLTDSGPLRLVGSGVANEGALTGKSVGKVTEIELTSFETGGSGTIPELHIVKYGEDGVTVIEEETITYPEMMEQFDVIGDGTTVYKYQGITNIADDIWSADDETVGGFKIENAIMGTRVSDLVSLVGDMGTGTDITFVAKDGWETTLPYSSIYPDPAVYARQGDAIIAWYADGKYVPDYKDGMRLFFTPEDHIYGQWDMHETLPEAYWHYYYGDVMYPSCAGLSPKYITEIKVYSVSPGDWTLELDGLDIGGLQKEISKTYFESALTCTFGANHKQSYTDSENRVWEGMPLWFLAGFVDDADQHSDNAFNNDLAAAGYQVVLTAEDGYSVTIDSQDIIRNNNYIVANTLDGLLISETDENWPLKLVGPSVTGSKSIGNIVSIELVSSSSLLTPPALTADTVENRVGQAIEITFTDDAAWRAAIINITIDGLNVADTRYTVSEGKITIADNVFTEVKTYTVVIKATGYEDASVVQNINSDKAVYTVTPVTDSAYTIGETAAGIKTMTVNAGIAGFNYFTVNIAPVASNSGSETAVFTHLRNGSQIQINSTRADFDQVGIAQAGFNVKAGDIIRVYIVDELTNAVDHNPVILQ